MAGLQGVSAGGKLVPLTASRPFGGSLLLSGQGFIFQRVVTTVIDIDEHITSYFILDSARRVAGSGQGALQFADRIAHQISLVVFHRAASQVG